MVAWSVWRRGSLRKGAGGDGRGGVAREGDIHAGLIEYREVGWCSGTRASPDTRIMKPRRNMLLQMMMMMMMMLMMTMMIIHGGGIGDYNDGPSSVMRQVIVVGKQRTIPISNTDPKRAA